MCYLSFVWNRSKEIKNFGVMENKSTFAVDLSRKVEGFGPVKP